MNYEGYISNTGYGLDYDPETKKTVLAHRLAFKQAYGYLPKVVMHTCDNKQCINPEHLKAGNQSDNIKDCINKGRYKSTQKLCMEDIIFVRSMVGHSSRKLAELLGVNQKTICNIRNYKYNYK